MLLGLGMRDDRSPELLETVPELLGVGVEPFQLGNGLTGFVLLLDSLVDDSGITVELLLRSSMDALFLGGLVC